jgi:glycosyltransferase involved in cell wall biosynthesis
MKTFPMRCPALKELPSPPPGKTGWPWTVETPQLPPARPDGLLWPRISVITPSYNQGRFIEDTIRSVLLQGYPDLEYMIIDGGSSDETVSIIKKYESWLRYWVSEKDGGQPNAINKGLRKATGEIFNWINSDDLLVPSALEIIGTAARTDQVIAGSVINFGVDGRTLIRNRNLTPRALVISEIGTCFHQPGVWLPLKGVFEAGGIDESLEYAFDFELIIRYLNSRPLVRYVDRPVAMFRLHESSRTCSQSAEQDKDRRAIYSKLLTDSSYKPLHDICSERVRSYLWWDRIEAVIHSKQPPIFRAAQIFAEILFDPRIRFSRLSLGAIRRALMF